MREVSSAHPRHGQQKAVRLAVTVRQGAPLADVCQGAPSNRVASARPKNEQLGENFALNLFIVETVTSKLNIGYT